MSVFRTISFSQACVIARSKQPVATLSPICPRGTADWLGCGREASECLWCFLPQKYSPKSLLSLSDLTVKAKSAVWAKLVCVLSLSANRVNASECLRQDWKCCSPLYRVCALWPAKSLAACIASTSSFARTIEVRRAPALYSLSRCSWRPFRDPTSVNGEDKKPRGPSLTSGTALACDSHHSEPTGATGCFAIVGVITIPTCRGAQDFTSNNKYTDNGLFLSLAFILISKVASLSHNCVFCRRRVFKTNLTSLSAMGKFATTDVSVTAEWKGEVFKLNSVQEKRTSRLAHVRSWMLCRMDSLVASTAGCVSSSAGGGVCQTSLARSHSRAVSQRKF